MSDIAYPRVATILNDGNVVSSIASREGPPDRLDKRQEELNAWRYEAVSSDVRVGMVKAADGSFQFPAGHPDEPLGVRRLRDEEAASLLKSGRAA